MVQRLKIRVSCAGILDRCTVPMAVLVADIAVNGKPNTRTRYVLVDDDIRHQLSRLRRELGRDWDYGQLGKTLSPESAFPALIRTHAFNSAGVQFEPTEPIARRSGIWSNSESLWVRTDLAHVVLADLAEWQGNARANAPEPHQICAPSWGALLGAQALAMAADLPMPTAENTAPLAASQ